MREVCIYENRPDTTPALFAAVLAAILLSPRVLSADSGAPPQSSAVTSPNGAFVLVTIAPAPYRHSSDPLVVKYPISGLYRNDGSTTPLWKLDFCCPQVDVMNDGIHLLAWNPWPEDYDTYDQVVLWVFRNGVEIRRYHIRDLVAKPSQLLHSVSHYEWIKARKILPDGRRVRIWTTLGEGYEIDSTSGLIVSRLRVNPFETRGRHPLRLSASLAGFIAAFMALLGLALWWRLRRRTRGA